MGKGKDKSKKVKLKITSLEYRRSILIPTERYANQRVELGMVCDVQDDQNADEVFAAMQTNVNGELLMQAAAVKGLDIRSTKALVEEAVAERAIQMMALQRELKL